MRRGVEIDWLTLLMYLLIVSVGWLNLYSTSAEDGGALLALDSFHGREAIFIIASIVIGIIILLLDVKFIDFLSYIIYGVAIVLLLATLVLSKSTGGATAWINLGVFKLQPTEFAKVATLLALSKWISRFNFSMDRFMEVLIPVGIVLLPMLLVLLQNDAGSALVFCSLIFVFFREGLHPLFLVALLLEVVIGVIAIVFDHVPLYWLAEIIIFLALITLSWFFIFKRKFLVPHIIAIGILAFSIGGAKIVLQLDLLKPHHVARILVLTSGEEKIKKDDNLRAVNYHLQQTKVAIGSGGMTGKGYQNATHSGGDFVPEEHTDYIFCVWAEEHGFIGSTALIIFYFLFLLRLLYLAENSKTKNGRVFGYGVVSILFFHLMINLAMTIGLFPTIGIPLPFMSYGGSSMISFSTMIFILVNHFHYRANILS